MELDRIEIKNFRSIKDETIHFDHNCLILLGKNEAGKSNVLKAFAAIFGHYTVGHKDRRKKINNEKIEEYYCRAILKLSEREIKSVIAAFEKKFQNTHLIVFNNGQSLVEYVKKVLGDFLIRVHIEDGEQPTFSYWRSPRKDFDLENKIYCNGNELTTEKLGVEFSLLFELHSLIKEEYLSSPIKCHYWQYQDSYLLPSSVDISQFVSNPSSVKGLENIFILCGREDISEEFHNAKLEDGDYSNLLDQVSISITNTFQKIWKDFKGTEIVLTQNGTDILIKVANKAKYTFEDRSDGFKKFISILLMLSTQTRSNRIKEQDLIIIDEPDQSLYPTSVQYLRDELLEMSKKTKIVFSTHSQYMIDSDTIDRHLLVEKEDDITTLRKQDVNSPFNDDELLRRAIGSSIFECLKPKNIIFEGYLDRELFKKSNTFNRRSDFKDYGLVYLGGISSVETLVQLLLLANKKFIVVADSDETSKNKRNDFEKNYPDCRSNWFAYADSDSTIVTMEDFMTENFIVGVLKLESIDFQFDSSKNVVQNIDRLVNKDKERKQRIKNRFVKEIKKLDIKPEYNIFLDELKKRMESL